MKKVKVYTSAVANSQHRHRSAMGKPARRSLAERDSERLRLPSANIKPNWTRQGTLNNDCYLKSKC